MARSAVIKTKKKTTVRATRRLSGFALAPTNDFWKAKHFVHYEIESREWSNKVKEYVKRFLPKPDAAHINRLPEWKTSNYSHWAITAHCPVIRNRPRAVPPRARLRPRTIFVFLETKRRSRGSFCINLLMSAACVSLYFDFNASTSSFVIFAPSPDSLFALL